MVEPNGSIKYEAFLLLILRDCLLQRKSIKSLSVAFLCDMPASKIIFFFSEGGYAFYDFLFGFYEALHCLMLYFQLMLIVVYLHDYRIVDHDSVVVLFS